MKTIKLFTLLAALMYTTATWAQVPGSQEVYNETDLRNAVKKNAVIWFKADITLSSALVIDVNGSVSIHLNNHTLNRGLTKRGDNGQVISVRSGSTLILGYGTLTGGWGGDSGGLLNEGTVQMTDVNITGCTGDDRGGGICNYGTLTLDGCTIQNNTANNTGGGIWSAASATLNMKGAITVTNNTKTGDLADNVYLQTDAIITVASSLTGSNIGISMEHPGTFTSDYSTHNSGIAPATIFTPDIPSAFQVTLTPLSGEAFLSQTGSLYYINTHWDSTNKQVVKTTKVLSHWIDNNITPGEGDYKDITTGSGTFVLGGYNNDIHEYYMVRGNINRPSIDVQGHNVHIILCDGATLTVSNGILLYGEHRLYIHSQSYGASMGKLIANNAKVKNCAGIGGDGDAYGIYPKRKIGRLEVHGGDISAEGGEYAAGIGGGLMQAGDLVIVYGGRVEARGGNDGAGIGGGESGTGDGGYFGHGGEVTVYGGSVYAYGGNCGSGIGGSANGLGGYFTIYGGYVEARGSSGCAGIGSGCNQDYGVFTGTFNGGTVKAWGGKNGAGIGTGNNSESDGTITVNGGEIYAYGGDDGAGIGGGWDSNGLKVTINDGYVYAKGGGNGSGIGSGSESTYFSINGGNLTIKGGRVEAYGGVDAAGIGGGEDADGGTVNISGGYVYAEGNDYGPGIGGGQDAKGANVTITGGTVIAKAGRNETGMRAIGPGEGCDDYGKLTIGATMMVSSERLARAEERKNMCWYRTQARIEPCTHQDPTYTVSGTTASDTHTAHCKYCTKEFAAEPHDFFGGNGACTVCGVSGTAFNVSIYLPVINGSDGQYANAIVYQLAKDATFELPAAPAENTPTGMAFAGWLMSTADGLTTYVTQPGETLIPAGTEYTVASSVSFTARYQQLDITLADATDNSLTLLQYGGMTAHSVTLTGRTLKKNGLWNTLCLPFDLALEGSPLAGATLKELNVDDKWKQEGGQWIIDNENGTYQTGFDNGTLYLYFKNATSIEAGKAYLIKWDGGTDITNPSFSNVTINNVLFGVRSKDKAVAFAGIFSPKAIASEDKSILFLGADNKLYYPDDAMTIGSCRAYFRLKGITAGNSANGASILNFNVNFDDENDATGIRSMDNGQWIMDNCWYTLDGRKLDKKPTQKGVYIHHGKKIIIK